MGAVRRATAAMTAAALVAVLAAGCGADDEKLGARAPSVAPGTAATVPIATPSPRSPSVPTNAAEPPESPEPVTTPPPAAGPLTARNLPAPRGLGTGWRTYADPGGAEAGFLGNQTWTRARNAHQAAFEALPDGCTGPMPGSALPMPRYALQGSYRNPRGTAATVLVLRFPTPGEAAAYHSGYRLRMGACGSDPGAQLSVRGVWSESEAAAALRVYAGAQTYLEVSAVRGSSVGLLATATGATQAETAWSRIAAGRLTAVIDAG